MKALLVIFDFGVALRHVLSHAPVSAHASKYPDLQDEMQHFSN
jgi:hypothetical protein